MLSIKSKILIFICLISLVGVFNFVEAKSYYYHLIEVDITINSDSTFDVIEKQTYKLDGSFGYFYRDIELKRFDHISDIKVFDSNGDLLDQSEYELSYNGNKRHVQWNFPRRDFENELKSWTVAYKVHGGLGFYKDYDELYWNAIFADRNEKVLYADVKVYLPEGVKKEEISQRLFFGRAGDKNESVNYQILDDRTIRYMGVNLKAGEYLTIVATWPKELIKKPIFYRNQIINWIALLLALIIPLIVIRRSYKTWKKRGKDPRIDKTIIAQYQPPQDLAPGIVGILDDQSFSVKEVTATLVDLAVRGYIKIKEGHKKIFGQKEYTFEKLKGGGGLKSFERKIFNGIFIQERGFFKTEQVEKQEVSSSDLKNKFYKHLKDIKKKLHQAATETGYLTDNIEQVRKKYQIKYFILLVISLVLGFVSFILFLSFGPLLIGLIFVMAGLLFSSIIGLIFGHFMPALTSQGAEEKWKWLGFKEYLDTAERFRLGAETVDTFSKYLPYAIIFGVEKQWANRFADLEYQQPNWYVPVMIHTSGGPGISGASFSGLASSISSFSTSISSTFASAPGGSGAGAGGAAGGGGGGGGGGAG